MAEPGALQGLALRRGGVPALAVLLYGAAFLVGTSRLGLHWARWLIPLLPLLALFAASAADALVRLLAARFGWGRAGRRAATACWCTVAPMRRDPTMRIYRISRTLDVSAR